MKTKHAGTVSEADIELKKGPVYRFLADDHARLDLLLQRAFADPDQIDLHAYSEFRSGLLRHIAMEEKVLLPAAQQRRMENPWRLPRSCASNMARWQRFLFLRQRAQLVRHFAQS